MRNPRLHAVHALPSRLSAARTVAILLIASAGPVAAATSAELIGPDLVPRPVTLQALSDGVVSYFDAERALRHVSLDELVELVLAPAGARTDASSPARTDALHAATDVVLADGRRYRGGFVGVDDAGRIAIEHPDLGRLVVALDSLRSLRLRRDAATVDAASTGSTGSVDGLDVLTLTNGDALRGFVLAAAPDGLELQNETDAQTLTVPWDRLVSVQLAAMPAAAEAPSVGVRRLVLRDGTRVDAANLVIEGGTLTAALLAPERRVQLPLTAVSRISVGGAAGRVVSLFDQPVTVEQPAQVFDEPWPARRATPDPSRADVDAPALHLHAPTVLRYDLPPGSRRLAATLRLNVSPIEPARQLAHMVVILSQDGRELVRQTIDAAHDEQAVNLPVAPGPLTLTLDMGERGPVLDRLAVEHARLLIVP